MSTRALVVEDDPQVMETIEDTLFSIGHEHLWVTNQHDARDALRRHEFQYVLLDLQIPAKPNRGGASKEFGINLLREICERDTSPQTPVIVMTAYSSECLDMSTRLLAFGASEFIAKPFTNKEPSLAKVIHKAQVSRKSITRNWKASNLRELGLKPFAGGKLEFFDSYAELMGVKIISARGQGRALPVLKQLAERDNHGRLVRMSGEELANAIGAIGGVNAITAAIQTLRRNISARLRKLGFACRPDDVIAHDEQGYHLREWIMCGDEESIARGALLNERQQWMLEELRVGTRIERAMIENRWNVSEKTAKRDIAELVRSGLVVFVRKGRGGHYQLCSN